ncbi:unnamed protein product, partial [Prorocentrum cordatum]
MYFHRQHAAQATQGLRSAAPVHEADLEVAARLRERLHTPGPARQAADAAGDLVAQFVAEIRRDVEMLVLYGQVAVGDIVEASLRRHGLLGTPDAHVWEGVAAEIAAEAPPQQSRP